MMLVLQGFPLFFSVNDIEIKTVAESLAARRSSVQVRYPPLAFDARNTTLSGGCKFLILVILVVGKPL
jgi:hypothetical protein